MPNFKVEPGGLKVRRNSQNGGVPPSHNPCHMGDYYASFGGVEAHNERSLRVKYCIQGVQSSFY